MNDIVVSKIRSFTDLIAWQKGHVFVIQIYRLTREFPREEMFGLTSQLRRSAVSITANIAEGFVRRSYKEKIQFYLIAQSSLAESQNHLLIGHDLGYIKDDLFKKIYADSHEINKIIQGLIKVSRTRR